MSLLTKVETSLLFSHPEFSHLPRDTDDNPCVFQNEYECNCGQCWSQDWSCGCDDTCPACGMDCAPADTTWVGPVSEDLQVLWMEHFTDSAARLFTS